MTFSFILTYYVDQVTLGCSVFMGGYYTSD